MFSGEDEFKKAMRYYREGLLNEAEKHFKIAIVLLNKENPLYAYSLNNLACIYFKFKNYKHALDYLKKSLEIKYRFMSYNRKSLAIGLRNLGKIYKIFKKYDEARKCFRVAKAIEETKFIDVELYLVSNNKPDKKIKLGIEKYVCLQDWQYLKIRFKTTGFYAAYSYIGGMTNVDRTADINVKNNSFNESLINLNFITEPVLRIWYYCFQPPTGKERTKFIHETYKRKPILEDFKFGYGLVNLALKGIKEESIRPPMNKNLVNTLHLMLVVSYFEYKLATLHISKTPLEVLLFAGDKKTIIRQNQTLKSGDRVFIRVYNHAKYPLFLYIFNRDTNHNVQLLYPIPNLHFPKIDHNQIIVLPNPYNGYELDDNPGWEHIFLFYSKEKKDINALRKCVQEADLNSLIPQDINSINLKGYDGIQFVPTPYSNTTKQSNSTTTKQSNPTTTKQSKLSAVIILKFKHDK